MTDRSSTGYLHPLLRSVRAERLLVILIAALAAGLLADWIRRDRVVFSRPLPELTTVPAGK